MHKTMSFTDARSRRPFTVRLVERGDAYGRNDALIHHDKYEFGPMVEFYETSNAHPLKAPTGCFVSRYYVETLLGDEWGRPNEGLCLDGGQRQYDVCKKSMDLVRAWLAHETATREEEVR